MSITWNTGLAAERARLKNKKKKMKRIKHNDLTHYFMTPHEQLPASYLASCEEFFTWLKDCKKMGSKRQAPSSKRLKKDIIK